MGWEVGKDSEILQIIFFISSAVEVIGALLFLVGFEKVGIDMLIAYLFFTGVVLHHFFVKRLESSTMNILAFTQVVTVLGLLLYVRENLSQKHQYTKHKNETVHEEMVEDMVEDMEEGQEEEQEHEEEQVNMTKSSKKKAKKSKDKKQTLARVRSRIDTIDFGTIGTATHDERDDLQLIHGIGPFIEEKLHTLDIYTFQQIARMTPEIEDNVNIAIEFFLGRVRRDEWRAQAQEFVDERGYDWKEKRTLWNTRALCSYMYVEEC